MRGTMRSTMRRRGTTIGYCIRFGKVLFINVFFPSFFKD